MIYFTEENFGLANIGKNIANEQNHFLDEKKWSASEDKLFINE